MIALHITKDTAASFLEASQALQVALAKITHETEFEGRPLHDRVCTAARVACAGTLKLDKHAAHQHHHLSSHPSSPHNTNGSRFLSQFLTEIAAASLTEAETKGATMLFHDSDKASKLRYLFSLLSQTEDKRLHREGARSLFRTILTAIASCGVLQQPTATTTLEQEDDPHRNHPSLNHKNDCIVVEGKPLSVLVSSNSSPERPLKKVKYSHHSSGATSTSYTKTAGHGTRIGAAITGTTEEEEEEADSTTVPCQSPSWDSSLATLRDEDDATLPNVFYPSTATTTTATAVRSSSSATTTISSLRHQKIQEVCSFAADDLMRFAASAAAAEQSSANTVVDFATFGNWYNSSGEAIVPWIELLQHSKWKAPSTGKSALKEKKTSRESTGTAKTADISTSSNDDSSSSPGSLLPEDNDQSRTLVSFDFNGSGSPTPLLINISEDNLKALQALVQRTNLMQCSAADVCQSLVHAGTRRTMSNGKECTVLVREDFIRTVRTSIIPDYCYARLSEEEKKGTLESFTDFFYCFEGGKSPLHEGEVDLKEFAVGFCFFCAGNKSSKLSSGFDLLDSKQRGYLTEDQLLRYLQSYLTMLLGMSLLVPFQRKSGRRRQTFSPEKRKTMRIAIENGAKWTLGHFLRASGQVKNEYTFESFATWYSEGGYNIAPWLELLDLTKVLTLIAADPVSPDPLPPLETMNSNSRLYQTTARRPRGRDRVSSLRRHHLSRSGPQPEVLFTFPLGNRRSLVVLKEDATYVRAVVEQMGLLTMKPDDLWMNLSAAVDKTKSHGASSSQVGLATYINLATFVQCMEEVCPRASRKRSMPGDSIYTTSSTLDELLSNFYQCFDIDQCDSVALDELMGGLTLLCGGKKSHKLAFAFSIFDTRPGVHGPGKKRGVVHSLSGEDLFLFLRSILIVTFSTCRQSLDLADDVVSRCISDTTNMICNDVMRHQWETEHSDRLNFDEFGQWYNDGGFERAPWLELLDLRKWVLSEDLGFPPPPHNHLHHVAPPISTAPSRDLSILPEPSLTSIPPPPPDDALDGNFFDTDAIMPIDSVSIRRKHSNCCCDWMTNLISHLPLVLLDGRNGYDFDAAIDG